jgi:soluble lytic murein transglycosylase
MPVLLTRTDPLPAPIDERWAEAIRAGDYPEANRRLAALPAARAASAELRFVRARVAIELQDYDNARALLERLDQELPLLTKEITRARAEVALARGPFEEAARYYALRGDPAALVKAALALERAGKLGEARVTLDHVVRMLGSDDDAVSVAIRVQARASRARIAGLAHDVATEQIELRWLAVEAPDTDVGAQAVTALAALMPPSHLTAEQHLLRAKHLAEASRITEALAAIEAAAAARDKPSLAVLTRARASAYYVTRADYVKASGLFTEAARLDPKEAPRDSFLSARALARAGDDPHAIERYEALSRKYPMSPFAEEASYQAARLRFLLGQWDASVHAYRAYIDAHPKRRPGRFIASARYELSLALLAGGHGQEAATSFGSLLAVEDDPLDRATLRELLGASLAVAGDREHAVVELNAVVRERPLSFPALASVARLLELGEAAPPLVAIDAQGRAATPLEIALPERAALLARLGYATEAAQELASREQELLARYAPRGYEALCDAYGKVGAGAERYRVGRNAVKSDALDRAPTDATRWAWDCVYPTPFSDLVRAAESERALPYGLLHAIMRQESAFRPDAVSSARAVGLLQLVPGTAEKVAVELGQAVQPSLLATPSYNVELGAYYVHKILTTFGGHVALAAAAYNAGPRAVSRWLEAAETLPLDIWVARIPFAETRGYVTRVIGNLARYSYLHGGEAAVPRLSLALPKGIRVGPEDY